MLKYIWWVNLFCKNEKILYYTLNATEQLAGDSQYRSDTLVAETVFNWN